MFQLDFAYFNLINVDKRGLLSRKFWLERLTPIFFKPRLEKLIDLPDFSAKGCNITVPLGLNNFDVLNESTKGYLINKSFNIINDYDIHYMAVDRNLKNYFPDPDDNLIFGDNFIKALAHVIIGRTLNKHQIKRIIIVGETEYFPDFLEILANFELPISMQNSIPREYEIISHRILYESGCAVSNSYLAPENWNRGDIVLAFTSDLGGLSILAPELYSLEFTNTKVNIIPELASSLLDCGLELGINSLAPIFETSIWSKKGFLDTDGEKEKSLELFDGQSFLKLQELGEKLGIWDLFLDKLI